jgi:hypothetical protein
VIDHNPSNPGSRFDHSVERADLDNAKSLRLVLAPQLAPYTGISVI